MYFVPACLESHIPAGPGPGIIFLSFLKRAVYGVPGGDVSLFQGSKVYHCPLPPPISSSLKLSLRLFLYHKSSHRAQVYDLSHYLTNKLPLDTSPHYHSLCHTRTARSSRSSGGGDYMLSEIAQNRSVIVAASRAENTSQISSNRRPVRHGNRRHLLPLGVGLRQNQRARMSELDRNPGAAGAATSTSFPSICSRLFSSVNRYPQHVACAAPLEWSVLTGC